MIVEIHISGNNIKKSELFAKEFLRELSPTEASRSENYESINSKDITTMSAVAAVVLAIPSAIISTRDIFLKKRLEKRIEYLEKELNRVHAKGIIKIEASAHVEIEINGKCQSQTIDKLLNHLTQNW